MVEVLSSSVHVVYIFLFSEEWVPVSQQLTGVSHRSLLPAAYKSKLYYQTILNVTCVKMVSAQTKFIVIPQMHMSFLSLSRRRNSLWCRCTDYYPSVLKARDNPEYLIQTMLQISGKSRDIIELVINDYTWQKRLDVFFKYIYVGRGNIGSQEKFTLIL